MSHVNGFRQAEWATRSPASSPAPSPAMRSLAVCMSGQPRMFSSYVESHLLLLTTLNRSLAFASIALFVSLHSQVDAQLQAGVKRLQPAALEFWHNTSSTCSTRCASTPNFTVGMRYMRCSFFWQFSGVNRVWHLLKGYERQHSRSFGYILRLRPDIVCPTSHLELLLGTAQIFGASVDPLVHERFRGMTRQGSAADVSASRFSDMAWVSTRTVAESLMTVIEEFHGGCGELLDPATLQSRCSEPINFMYYECILMVRLRAWHPNVIVVPTLPHKLVCAKLCGEGTCRDREAVRVVTRPAIA